MTKGDKKNIILERRKPKNPQKQNPEIVDGRDTFQTPNYAIDLLIPFIPDVSFIWECTSGKGKIGNRLTENGYTVFMSDLIKEWNNHQYNFITGERSEIFNFYSGTFAIVTNPPFSLKQKFYNKCLEYDVPFALLIPADYSGWIIKAVNEDGAEKIIPTRRIDYLTPDMINRINFYEDTNYLTFDEIPQELLYRYSSSQFHSMWLTHGFNLGKTETFVELSLKEKKENI